MSDNTLEIEFIEDFVDKVMLRCECADPECNSKGYIMKGKTVDYVIEYDSTGKGETNVFIRIDITPMDAVLQGIEPVVFNGYCGTNMDFATALRMVIK